MKLQEIMLDAMDMGNKKLAHFIYWASTQGVSLEGGFESLKHLKPDGAEIDRLTTSNFLGANPVGVYSYKKGKDFHLCLARDHTSAKSCLSQATREFNPKVLEVPEGIYQDLVFEDSGEHVFIFEIRDRCVDFPHYIGTYRKDGYHDTKTQA